MDVDSNVITDRMWILTELECLGKPTAPCRTTSVSRKPCSNAFVIGSSVIYFTACSMP